jgi:hypothetical protein
LAAAGWRASRCSAMRASSGWEMRPSLLDS